MRVANFSAGPAGLPDEVMQAIAKDLCDWQGKGYSVVECSHRGQEFLEVAKTTQDLVRELLAVPEDYAVLFLQGGATGVAAALPLNLLEERPAAYVVNGHWGRVAAVEARNMFGEQIELVFDAPQATRFPDWSAVKLTKNYAYLHLCTNETLVGIEDYSLPETNVPIIADMSSTLFSRPFDISKYAAVYAGAQKNFGPAGLVLLIINKQLIERKPHRFTPRIFNFATQEKSDSMTNTPNSFGIYVAGLVLDWLKKQGGLPVIYERNKAKAGCLYQAIDTSKFYSNSIAPEYRSLMNVTFRMASKELEAAFVAESKKHNLIGLKGHRAVGGLRASLYNALSLERVEELVRFMHHFEQQQSSP